MIVAIVCVFSSFLKEKSIQNLKNDYNMQRQYLCCNNTGENVAFEKACKQEGLGVDFAYTAPGKPQQNCCIEQKITTLFNWVCAMLNSGKFNAFLCHGSWAKAVNTFMHLKNNLLTLNKILSLFQ